MRRWGRVPICKTFKPDHELGIRTHATLMRKERKRRSTKRVVWEKSDQKKRKEFFAALWFEKELGNKLVLDVRIWGQGFHYKLINKTGE